MNGESTLIVFAFAAGLLGATNPSPDLPAAGTFVVPAVFAGSWLDGKQYARLSDDTRLYPKPDSGLRPLRNTGAGFLMSTVKGPIERREGAWYEVNAGEYARAENVQLIEPTRFRGVAIKQPASLPFGWIRADVRPSPRPGAPPDPAIPPLSRYRFFEILDAASGADGSVWYRVDRELWVPSAAFRRVDSDPRPRGVGHQELWVEIDLGEQTVAAYEGDQMVFASLVSSGLDRWPTRQGLFWVKQRRALGKMSGEAGTKDYYFVEDVPYAMFFDSGIALHGAYWHDKFGNQVSHGCVNMPPRDAEWVYRWSERAPTGLRVWVHSSRTRDQRAAVGR
jgi:hypothetical protein